MSYRIDPKAHHYEWFWSVLDHRGRLIAHAYNYDQTYDPEFPDRPGYWYVAGHGVCMRSDLRFNSLDEAAAFIAKKGRKAFQKFWHDLKKLERTRSGVCIKGKMTLRTDRGDGPWMVRG